jgi:hypothetical protein
MANPNPSPENRFRPGQSGNPGGKSSEHVEAERKAAEISALMRLQVLSTMQEKVSKITESPDASLDDILKLLDGDVLRLFKDSEDRAHGTPRQSVEHSGSVDHKHSARNMTDDELAAYLRNDIDQG